MYKLGRKFKFIHIITLIIGLLFSCISSPDHNVVIVDGRACQQVSIGRKHQVMTIWMVIRIFTNTAKLFEVESPLTGFNNIPENNCPWSHMECSLELQQSRIILRILSARSQPGMGSVVFRMWLAHRILDIESFHQLTVVIASFSAPVLSFSHLTRIATLCARILPRSAATRFSSAFKAGRWWTIGAFEGHEEGVDTNETGAEC